MNKKPLSDADIIRAIEPVLEKAESNGTRAEYREQALALYNREAFPGDEKIPVSRSRYVTSEVYDQVEMIVSQLLSLFEGQEDVVTYQPRGSEDVALAEQQTDIVNWVLRDDNELTLLLNDWFKNGQIYGMGIAYADFYKSTKWRPPVLRRGVPDTELHALLDDDTKDVREVGDPYDVAANNIPGLPMQPPIPVRDIKVATSDTKAGVRIQVIPPEDFILSADATFDYNTGGINAGLQGYRCTMPRRELIEMGYDAKLVAKIPTADQDMDSLQDNRDPRGDDGDAVNAVEPDVEVREIFMRMATEGEETAPLMRFTIGGASGKQRVLLNAEEVEMAPFAAFVPVIDPNTVWGKGVADIIGQDQKYKSKIYRGMQDNFHQVLHPRATVRTDAVDMDDFLNDEIGGLIRVDEPNAVGYLDTPFVGGMAFSVIERVNADIETRTGTGMNTLALNPEDLKKTTATASSQRLSNAQLRVDKIARLFAATGYRYLFRVIGSLLASHPEDTNLILQRMRNRVVEFSFDHWDTAMDVRANVSFGNTDKPQKTQALMNILAMQKEDIQQLLDENRAAQNAFSRSSAKQHMMRVASVPTKLALHCARRPTTSLKPKSSADRTCTRRWTR
ncbi:hypothetical protein U0C82_08240 [Fulvimarina sp. 2208YS6-2-32]|uniref:Portal protein n=1 Tax=Fulvimarina uroteuthidis TaxID=3098149 RepID=A0ABU5I2Y1_9HYPH|nr:hypothetical protein [Fulvimarina sp. 2208YS6-2-32]MDY8109133.1 hypothetical protein [Fulvimarina sp. 2208YS6-2-32]